MGPIFQMDSNQARDMSNFLIEYAHERVFNSYSMCQYKANIHY